MDIQNLINAVEELSLEDGEFKQQVEDVSSTIKLIFLEAKENEDELSKLVEKHLTPSSLEKKKNAEVSTPDKLCKEMLEPLKKEIQCMEEFKESNGKINRVFKILEPCSGKGIFLLNIYKFLKDNSTLSKKQILEECIYFADISPLNIFICKLLLDPKGEYALNYQTGDSLKMKWDVVDDYGGFDAVIGNPPYNSSGTLNTGNTIWQHFVKISLNEWIKREGYLCYVHPSGWRKPEYYKIKSKTKGLFKLMTKENTMLCLTMRGLEDGKKTFNCGTRYDYYLIKKEINNNFETKINDEIKVNINLCLSDLEWLPNYNIKKILNLLSSGINNNLNVLYDRSIYGADKKNVSNKKTYTFKYPLIHSTNKSGIRYMYSNCNDKGHFGISKVIFGDSGINDVIIDIGGKFGMTQHAFALIIDNLEEGHMLKKALMSRYFQGILKACMWSNFQIEWKLFTYFKKDFYKYLDNEE